jgi:Ser/Thr protein kinase RdoA (MazF antagonist)
MMKLSTMKALVATLNERWESAIVDAILSRWAHDPGTARYYRASANFLFTFKQAGQDYVLRFNHADERTSDYIQAELDYLHHLAASGIAVARPIRSLSGNDVESVSTAQGVFHAVVFEALPGKQVDFDEVTPEMFRRWGKALGELHQAAQGYAGGGRLTWDDHLALIADRLPPHEKSARKALDQLDSRVRKLPIHPQNFGLIHFDFELDNIIWDGNRLGLIDFDDCAWYWFVADIAFALRDLFDDSADQIDFDHPALHAFLNGYRTAKGMDQDELQLIPLFLRIHNLLTFAKLLHTLASSEQPDDPTWLGELRQKLTRKVNTYRESFANYAQ